MWVFVSTAFITAAVIFIAYGAAAVTAVIGFYIMLFVQ